MQTPTNPSRQPDLAYTWSVYNADTDKPLDNAGTNVFASAAGAEAALARWRRVGLFTSDRFTVRRNDTGTSTLSGDLPPAFTLCRLPKDNNYGVLDLARGYNAALLDTNAPALARALLSFTTAVKVAQNGCFLRGEPMQPGSDEWGLFLDAYDQATTALAGVQA